MSSTDGIEANSTEEGNFRVFHNPSWRIQLMKPTHIRYCRHLIFNKIPADYQEYDVSKLTFLHFGLSSLDILQSIDSLNKNEKNDIIESIYSLMVSEPPEAAGFVGTKTMKFQNYHDTFPIPHYSTHVTMTFAALVSLITLGDDLSGLNRQNILLGVSYLQNKDGSFRAGPGCCESDMRFVYSAIAVCAILNDFSLIDIPNLLNYIKNSFTYEGSCGSGSWGTEGHAAYTYCAISTLVLLGKLNEVFTEDELDRTRRWCLFRQINGFTGRPNKEEDTCYSFWVGATLAMLDRKEFSDSKENINFLLHNQNPIVGGLGKASNEYTDPLHTFMGLAGLSLANYDNLEEINPSLIMTQRAFSHLKIIQQSW